MIEEKDDSLEQEPTCLKSEMNLQMNSLERDIAALGEPSCIHFINLSDQSFADEDQQRTADDLRIRPGSPVQKVHA
jgi:hypothetical protein